MQLIWEVPDKNVYLVVSDEKCYLDDIVPLRKLIHFQGGQLLGLKSLSPFSMRLAHLSS